jgi:hypothetical protein
MKCLPNSLSYELRHRGRVTSWVYRSGSHTKELTPTLRHDAIPWGSYFRVIKPEHHENQANGTILGETEPCSRLTQFIQKLTVAYKCTHAFIISNLKYQEIIPYRNHLWAYKHEHVSMIFNSKYKA